MNPRHFALGRALVLSLGLHAALLAAGARLSEPRAPAGQARTPLTVWLREELALPELQVQALPRLPMPEDPRQHPIAAKPKSLGAAFQALSGEAARTAQEQMAHELMYPLEAIERGLQGEVLVLLFLDASGNAIAARIESSSGHALLDDAAIRAARSLRALPDNAPREALLPVRFRLR